MIDRSVDVLSPFVTQKTYEGQIDEHFNIHCNSVYVDESVLSSSYVK